jgi:hypothetical protein
MTQFASRGHREGVRASSLEFHCQQRPLRDGGLPALRGVDRDRCTERRTACNEG